MKRMIPLILLLAPACQAGHEQISSPDHPVVKAFIASKSLIPTWSKNAQPPVKEWDQILNLGGNLSLRITASGWIAGRFVGQYSDEPTPRLMGNPGDYVYPCDIRIDSSKTKIYGKASGLAGGIQQVTILFEFDIRSRTVIHSYQVDSKLLPPNPEPSAPSA